MEADWKQKIKMCAWGGAVVKKKMYRGSGGKKYALGSEKIKCVWGGGRLQKNKMHEGTSGNFSSPPPLRIPNGIALIF